MTDIGRGPSPSVPARVSRPAGSRLLLVIVGFVAFFLCLLGLGKIAEDVHEKEASALDSIATPLLHSISNPTLDAVMRTFTDLGSTMVVVPPFTVALCC